jgi:hypothetical protein
MRKSIYVYAWDLKEEGLSTVAARFRDAGLDTISVATSYHAGKFIRPHAPGRRVYFPEDGTIYFGPDARRYGRIKPRVSNIVAEFDVLSELERHAPDLDRVGWTVGLHNTPLGMAYPELTARTLFGDPLFNSLCPSQPEVRAYLVALCSDLGANYALTELAIETPGWQAFRHGHHHEFNLINLSGRAEAMLGFCFCGACRAGAREHGIDIDGLATSARRDLDQFFADGSQPAIDPQSGPEWRAFHAWRANIVADLVREVREELAAHVSLAIIPTVESPNRRCWIEGSDLALLADVADRLEVPAYQAGVKDILADVDEVRALAGADARLGYILRPSYPNLLSAGEVRDAVRALIEKGAESIAFYNYGHMRLQSMEWIKAALS